MNTFLCIHKIYMAKSPQKDIKALTYTHVHIHLLNMKHTGNKECSLIIGHMLHIKTLEVQLHLIELCRLCGRHTQENPLQRITTYRWVILLETAAATHSSYFQQ